MSQDGIRDARTLGKPKMLLLGFQHMFAMFGATVLVPALTGLSVSATLLFAGLGTLLFHFLTKGKVPAFLGSSFAFIGGYAAVQKLFVDNPEMNWIPYAGVGVVCAGLMYVVLAALVKAFGARKVMRFFPPIVTGPVIICIGLTLANSAINNCEANWWIAVLAIVIVVSCNIWGKGMIKIVPILLGVVGSYLVAVLLATFCGETVEFASVNVVQSATLSGNLGSMINDAIEPAAEALKAFAAQSGEYVTNISMTETVTSKVICAFGNPSMKLCTEEAIQKIKDAAWIGLPFAMKDTVFSLFGNCDLGTLGSAILIMMPIALATMVEHIGDICAISSTVGENYVEKPGLHRTLMGDGLATAMAALFGAPANTTYGENTGVLAMTKVYDPRVIRIAAVLAILFSFCPKFAAIVSAMPTATIGGVSMILYGMISAVGVRNVVENQVDFTRNRNIIIAALIMSLSLGITFSGTGKLVLGSISLTGLAVGALVGIVLNAVLPGNDYQFGKSEQGDTSVNFKV